ncbi:MAG: polyprenyl synthetase family protein, partial [Hoylesella buccalis]
MDYLSLIQQPIVDELNDFDYLYNESLSHGDGLLSQALSHNRQRKG